MTRGSLLEKHETTRGTHHRPSTTRRTLLQSGRTLSFAYNSPSCQQGEPSCSCGLATARPTRHPNPHPRLPNAKPRHMPRVQQFVVNFFAPAACINVHESWTLLHVACDAHTRRATITLLTPAMPAVPLQHPLHHITCQHTRGSTYD